MGRWKKLESRKVAKSTFFTLEEDDVKLPDGRMKTYTMLEIPDFAGVLPVIDDKLVMIKNYRYPIDEMVLELPAGLIDEDESPMETAERELEEETGYILKNAEKLVEHNPIASLNTQKAHLFIGDAEKGGELNRDKGEEMEVNIILIKEIYKKLENRELSHPHTMIALFYAKEILLEGID